METLEQIIELVRKRKSAEATQLQASLSDPVARKLTEWMILRSDDNGASSERYKAFITENPGWPSVIFLRRRGRSALWDDKRDDSAVLSFFNGEQPISAKGRFMLARALLARGDRPSAERLVREAWRSDSFSSDTEDTAFERFGTLLTPATSKCGWICCCIAATTEKPHCVQPSGSAAVMSRWPKHVPRSTGKPPTRRPCSPLFQAICTTIRSPLQQGAMAPA
jgi:hypothetical protein